MRSLPPLLIALALLTGCGTDGGSTVPAAPSDAPSSAAPPVDTATAAFAALEQRFGARLGVFALDTGSGRTVTHRADERFAHASTFKALQAAVVLRRSTDADLRKKITYSRADLLEYAPVTSKRLGTGMTVTELLTASLQYSDNTAANLLFEHLGGPEVLERELRGLGDDTTSIDRIEPDLNEAAPGDTRDTSTPRALGTDLHRLVLGDALPAERRTQLTEWMKGNITGGPYIRAGVPAGWTVGDKTGSGGYGTRNDIAVVWPPTGAPLIIALQSDRGVPGAPSADALLAEATKAVVTAIR
jgi:beta-lactamase class A